MIGRSTLRGRFGSLEIRERGAFWRLTGVLFLVYMASGLWSPLFSVYFKGLGAGTRDIGLVVAIQQATTLLSQYWWGRRSDRLGRRKPLLLFGTAGLACAYLLIASLSQWRWLFGIRIIEGFSLAAYSTGSLALIGDLLENQKSRGRLMGLYRQFGSLAFALAALSGGLLSDHLSIRVPLVLAALCYSAAFLLVTQIRERGVSQPIQQPTTDTPPVATSLLPADPRARRALLPFLGVTFIWTCATTAVVSLWPVYMHSVGYSQTAVGGLWGLAAMGEAPCFLLAGYLADRWGRKPVLLTGILCMATVYLGYTLSTVLAWLIAVQVLRSFAYACFEGPALLLATELGLRRQRGRLASLYYSVGGGGGIVGATAGGAIAQALDLTTMIRVVVVFMVVGAATVGRALPRLRTAPTPALSPQPVAREEAVSES